MPEDVCSSWFFQAVTVLNLVMLFGNGFVLALLALKMFKGRKNLDDEKSTMEKMDVEYHQYEPVKNVQEKMKIVGEAKILTEEGIYHIPQESHYVNDSALKTRQSYLEVHS